jgi:hypothetical protein
MPTQAIVQTIAKPFPEKLNPAHDAAVRHMLAAVPRPKVQIRKTASRRPAKAKSRRA